MKNIIPWKLVCEELRLEYTMTYIILEAKPVYGDKTPFSTKHKLGITRMLDVASFSNMVRKEPDSTFDIYLQNKTETSCINQSTLGTFHQLRQ